MSSIKQLISSHQSMIFVTGSGTKEWVKSRKGAEKYKGVGGQI